MNKFLIFLAGFISGAVCLFLFSLIVTLNASNGKIGGLTLFEKPDGVIQHESFKVFQVIEGGHALAEVGKLNLFATGYNYSGNMIVLFMADENTHYYDDQIINVPKGKLVKQVGIYQYPTERSYNTVPVVAIFGWERPSE